MIDYTRKSAIERASISCVTRVKCDVCKKDCVVEPIDDSMDNGIKYCGIVHAFKVESGHMYDPDLNEYVYIHECDCCSAQCVYDLLNRKCYNGKTFLEDEPRVKIKKVNHYIVKDNDAMDNNEVQTEVAKNIWDIAKISPEHGNAVMDIIGDKAYDTVMTLANEENNNG